MPYGEDLEIYKLSPRFTGFTSLAGNDNCATSRMPFILYHKSPRVTLGSILEFLAFKAMARIQEQPDGHIE